MLSVVAVKFSLKTTLKGTRRVRSHGPLTVRVDTKGAVDSDCGFKDATHPDLNELLHKVEEERVDLLQLQHGP